MWLPYAHALVLIDQPRLAMGLYQQHLLSGGYIDNEWFIFYADALEEAELFKDAYETRLIAWHPFHLGSSCFHGNTKDLAVLLGLVNWRFILHLGMPRSSDGVIDCIKS